MTTLDAMFAAYFVLFLAVPAAVTALTVLSMPLGFLAQIWTTPTTREASR